VNEAQQRRPLIQRAIDRAAAARSIPGNRVVLLQDGPQAYAAMLAIIAGAKRYVRFENYIIRDDATGWRFAEALAERAKAGVSVKVLYDWFGSIGTGHKYWRFLRQAGCDVRAFNPPNPFHPIAFFSRDHRKLVLADGGVSIIGGLCIADEWAGDPEKGVPPWRDTAVLIEGPASLALDLAFSHTWSLAGSPVPEDEVTPSMPPCGDAAIRIVAGEPGRERASRVLEYLTAGCRRRLWIVDAYLLPPPRLFEVMALAEKDGVDVRLLVPGSSDLPVIRNLTRLGYRDILRAGMRIFEWDGPMIHAKTMVADGRWTRVGTSNINLSSLVGNYELDVVIEDADLARTMELQFRRDIWASVEVVRRPRRAPEALQRMIPSKLARRHSRAGVIARSRGRRELRTRAMVAARRVMSGAFRSTLGPVALILLVLGLLGLGLPTVVGYVVGALSVVMAGVFGLQVWRRREGGV
jgi:cardiolipin synthase